MNTAGKPVTIDEWLVLLYFLINKKEKGNVQWAIGLIFQECNGLLCNIWIFCAEMHREANITTGTMRLFTILLKLLSHCIIGGEHIVNAHGLQVTSVEMLLIEMPMSHSQGK